MITVEFLKQRKEELGLSIEDISKKSGVPFGTVQKVFSGATKRPRFQTMTKLAMALKKEVDYRDILADSYRNDKPEPVIIRDAAYAYGVKNEHYYPRQGHYTLDDYYALPDEQRVELIDGVFYDMTAPTPVHQLIGGEIFRQIANYINENKGPCVPFCAPTDVQLDGLKDNRTMVQPDVFILCRKKLLQKSHIIGAPDFIAEVLSPSTRKKDMTKKLQKYTDAGVREYWLVDPDKGRVIVYDLEHDCQTFIYTFHDLIPVHIYNGDLKIDFPGMPAYITRFYDENGDPIELENDEDEGDDEWA